MLGLLLFLIFINDLDTAARNDTTLIKFADDTKMARVVGCEEERNALQQSLDGLVEWSDKWGMEFNVSKCKVMHLGRHNKQFEYFMGGQTLANTEEERDLGVVMSNKLKPAAQCAKAA